MQRKMRRAMARAKKAESKPKAKRTPSFIIELPLIVKSWQRKILLSRFEAGRQLYNACLCEALKRSKLMTRSVAYRQALELPTKTEEERLIRAAVFKEIRSRYAFSDAALQSYAAVIRKSWIGRHIDAVQAQKLATRAFDAVMKTLTGNAGKVRFKRYGELDSLEGKSNKSSIIWKGNRIAWGELTLPAIIDRKDEVIKHGLNSRVKYVRVVKRIFKGKTLFYAQLISEGKPFVKEKNTVGPGKIGLDIGPSTIAMVGDQAARLDMFCKELESNQQELRRLQRKLDRQRRANNPDNYNADGTVRKGCREWHWSHGYNRTKAEYAEVKRKQAAHRKSLQGKLANEIARSGNIIYLEDLSYKALQKNFGKSVGFRAPAAFVGRLEAKVKAGGGKVVKFATRTTALSQFCQCGKRKKKALGSRWHRCSCGVTCQRDLYSAYLARHVFFAENQKWLLDFDLAKAEWLSAKPLIDKALTETKNTYFQGKTGVKPVASMGLSTGAASC